MANALLGTLLVAIIILPFYLLLLSNVGFIWTMIISVMVVVLCVIVPIKAIDKYVDNE